MKNLMIIGGVIVVAAGGYLVWSLNQEKGSMAEAPKMETTTPDVVVIDPAEEDVTSEVEVDVTTGEQVEDEPETVEEQVEAVQDAAETAVQDIQDTAAEQVEAVEETATDAVNEIVNDTADAVNDAPQVADTAVEAMTDAANEAADSANEAVNSAMEKINDAAHSASGGSTADTSVSSETSVEGSAEQPKPASE